MNLVSKIYTNLEKEGAYRFLKQFSVKSYFGWILGQHFDGMILKGVEVMNNSYFHVETVKPESMTEF